jgi:hypothetical protein
MRKLPNQFHINQKFHYVLGNPRRVDQQAPNGELLEKH